MFPWVGHTCSQRGEMVTRVQVVLHHPAVLHVDGTVFLKQRGSFHVTQGSWAALCLSVLSHDPGSAVPSASSSRSVCLKALSPSLDVTELSLATPPLCLSHGPCCKRLAAQALLASRASDHSWAGQPEACKWLLVLSSSTLSASVRLLSRSVFNLALFLAA